MAKYSGSGWRNQSTRHSNARKTGHAGGTYSKDKYSHNGNYRLQYLAPNNKKTNSLKGGLADGIDTKYFNQLELSKGIKVELEHINNPSIAREVAQDHIAENPVYYKKLERIEGKTKPITIEITKKQIMRDKNQLEKELSEQIDRTKNLVEKQKLQMIYEELRKADDHTKIKRFIKEYGYALSTIAESIPFYFLAPLATAGLIIGSTITGDVPDVVTVVPRIGMTMTASAIGMMGVKYGVKTINAIKKREKEIIIEKSQELKDNTTLPAKEIKIIAKRVAQQELENTPLVHELVQ
jgi:hypothetical protein